MTPPKSESDDNIPETHNYTEAVGTRLTPKTKRRFDEYQNREGGSSAEALRRLVRDGLDAQEPDTWRDRAGRAAVLLLVIGYPTLAASEGETQIAFYWIVGMLGFILFEPWLADYINRIPNPVSWLK